jgi:hypothetical protein
LPALRLIKGIKAQRSEAAMAKAFAHRTVTRPAGHASTAGHAAVPLRPALASFLGAPVQIDSLGVKLVSVEQ